MSETCVGPSKDGEVCGREAKRRDLCAAHYRQWLVRGRDYDALEVLKGPQGQKYEDPQRLPLTVVDGAEFSALENLGSRLPEHPTDKRRTSLPLRGLRHLVSAYAAGGVRLIGSWRVKEEA